METYIIALELTGIRGVGITSAIFPRAMSPLETPTEYLTIHTPVCKEMSHRVWWLPERRHCCCLWLFSGETFSDRKITEDRSIVVLSRTFPQVTYYNIGIQTLF